MQEHRYSKPTGQPGQAGAHARTRSLIFRWLWCGIFGALLGGSLLGCSDSSLVLISVGHIDPSANLLIVQARLGETQFVASPRFSVDPASLGADGRYSFGLRIHDRTSGQLSLSIASLNESGSDDTHKLCLVQTTASSQALAMGEQPMLEVDLPSLTFDGTGCNGDLPIVQRAVQELVDNQPRMAIEGFGFVPGSELLLDGGAQTFVVNDSPFKLYAELPMVTAPSGARAVRVEVQLPDGGHSNTVNYIASETWFSTPAEPIFRGAIGQSSGQSGQTIEIYTGATTGDYNGDKLLDVAVTGYVYQNGKRGSGFVDIFLNGGRGLSSTARVRSAVWTNSSVADPANITAEAIVSSNYRLGAALDLIVAISSPTQGSGGFVVLNNDGQGRFTPTSTYVLSVGQPSPSAIAHVDVNATVDAMGHDDVVLLTNAPDGSARLNVFLSDVNGNIGTSPYWAIDVGQQASGFTTVDINQDGATDFALIATGKNDASQAQLRVLLNYRDGKLWNSFVDTQQKLTLSGFGGAVLGVPLFGGGVNYLVASDYAPIAAASASIHVMKNAGTQNTMRPLDAPSSPSPPDEPVLSPLPQIYAAGAKPFSLAALDADHDGRTDIATALSGDSSQAARIVILRHRAVSDDSQDLFPAGSNATDPLPTINLWDEIGDVQLLAADLTGDTALDLIAIVRGDGAARRPGSVWFLRNQ